MKTILKLGPSDHGRELTLEEFLQAEYEEGWRYELIDGRLYVVPAADPPQAFSEFWLHKRLMRYSDAHPESINFLCPKARVFIPGRTAPTAPEPDLSAYRDYPLLQDINTLNWEEVTPILVVEVISASDPDKDLERNVELYLQVPSIREYWILDGREDVKRPTLLVYRRRGNRWQHEIRVEAGETSTTRLLPGLALVVDPFA